MAQTTRPKGRSVAQLKNTILNTALTTHYECGFNPPPAVMDLIPNYNKAREGYILSCAEASLPGTSLATAELTNDHSGITERHAYRRQYGTTASFTFLVDRNYSQIQLFETWIGYIVNEQNTDIDNYFYRVNFPNSYKRNIWITKFERDLNKKNPVPNLKYTFINAYPISIDAIPVTYESAQVLRCTVNFNFSRYITNLTNGPKVKYPVLGDSIEDTELWRSETDTQAEVDRDNEQYGDSVPQGSFGITGQGANRDANRHNPQNSNAAKVRNSNFLPFIK